MRRGAGKLPSEVFSTTGSLAGRTVVVAGASSGIGLATAIAFYDQGANVHALARRKDIILKEAGQPRLESGRFVAHALDTTNQPAVAQTIATIAEANDIDVLVYAAGLNATRRRVADLSPEDWDAIVRVNLSGAFYVISAALASLRARCGTVILISSASARWTNVSGAAYQASKVGLLGLARAAAYEEHENGVRFSVVLPGVVDTPHLRHRDSPPSAQTLAAALMPEDVAGACVFLAGLPARAYVPEMILLPTLLQAPGKTDERSRAPRISQSEAGI